MTAMEAAMQQPGESAGLSQVERVVDAFVAPTKTFTDIRRNASWWLPFLLRIVVSLAFASSIDHKIGFDQVAQANINRNAQAQQRMSTLTGCTARAEHPYDCGLHQGNQLSLSRASV